MASRGPDQTSTTGVRETGSSRCPAGLRSGHHSSVQLPELERMGTTSGTARVLPTAPLGPACAPAPPERGASVTALISYATKLMENQQNQTANFVSIFSGDQCLLCIYAIQIVLAVSLWFIIFWFSIHSKLLNLPLYFLVICYFSIPCFR